MRRNAYLPTALLWLGAAVPLLFFARLPKAQGTGAAARAPEAGDRLRQVLHTIRSLPQTPALLWFLVSNFLYVDVIHTIQIQMATYSKYAVGLTDGQVQVLLLVATAVAVVGGLLYGFLCQRVTIRTATLVALFNWVLVFALALLVRDPKAFTVVGVLAGIGLGGIKVTGRLGLIALVPKERMTEFFGFFTLAGEAASVLGPFVWAGTLALFPDRSPGGLPRGRRRPLRGPCARDRGIPEGEVPARRAGAVKAAVLALVRALVGLFYRRIEVSGLENAPREGPVLLIANHNNGLVDPMVVLRALPRPVVFVAKSTLWKIPVLRSILDLLGCVPVVRRGEEDRETSSKGEERNRGSFERLAEELRSRRLRPDLPRGPLPLGPSPLRTAHRRRPSPLTFKEIPGRPSRRPLVRREGDLPLRRPREGGRAGGAAGRSDGRGVDGRDGRRARGRHAERGLLAATTRSPRRWMRSTGRR